MRGAHWFAPFIEHTSSEHGTLGPAVRSHCATDPVGGKMLLHALEQLGVDDRQMLALVDQFLVHDLAEVDPVAQQVEQRAAAKGCSAQFTSAASDVALR